LLSKAGELARLSWFAAAGDDDRVNQPGAR
jgi:hypothetical protein